MPNKFGICYIIILSMACYGHMCFFFFLPFLINFLSLLMIKYSSPLTHHPLSLSSSYLVFLFSHVSPSLFHLSISKAWVWLSLSLFLSLDFLIKTPSPKLFSFSRCFEVIGCCELIDNDGSLSLSLSLSLS